MKKQNTVFITASLLLLVPAASFGFGSKTIKVTEITGVTEAQVAKAPDGGKALVMVRGKAAELFYKMMKNKATEQTGSEALSSLPDKNTTHWTMVGKQVSCSKLENTKKKRTDFACAFEVSPKGEIVAGVEPYSPNVFNLAKTATPAPIKFKKSDAGRALASVTPHPVYEKASAYVMYDKPENKRRAEDAMVVIRGKAAKEIMAFLQEGKSAKEFQMHGINGVKGDEISCVDATDKEKERCALVVSLENGAVSTKKNPLFR